MKIRVTPGMRVAFLLLFLTGGYSIFAQTRVINSAGTWSNTGIWTGGNIADVLGENASFTNSIGTVTIASPQNYTVGNVVMNSSNTLTINNGATLNIGNSGTIGNLTAGNNCTINVNGTLIIWGDLDPGGSFTIVIGSTGTLIIKDDFLPDNSSVFTSSGTVDIDGDFEPGGSATVTLNKTMDVGGNFTFANNGTISINSPANLNVTGNFVGGGSAAISVANGSALSVGGFLDISSNAVVAINGGFNVVGDFTAGGSLDLTVSSTGDLNIGDDITFANNAQVTVNGSMDVTGDFTGGGSANISVGGSGDLNIGDDVDLQNNAVINVAAGGSLDIVDDLTAGSNTDVHINGTVTIGDDVTVGNNSSANGTGTATIGGSCSDGTSNFCGVGPMQFLPIKLIYFNAEMVDDAAISLSWATSKEENFDRFELERANSNLNFIKITEVPSGGYNTETIQKYAWTDSSPFAGENYYRLKAVDLDGTFEYFKIASASASGNRKFSVFPNPTKENSVNYSINFDYSGNDKIIIMDGMGNLVQQASVSSMEGKLAFEDAVKPGLYFVRYVSENFTQTERLMVR